MSQPPSLTIFAIFAIFIFPLTTHRCWHHCGTTMKRLNLRVPDTTMAALRRQLEVARQTLGQRYSMNDLCLRKLGTSDGAQWHQSGTLTIPRVPPPPPIPIITTHPVWPIPVSETPQPERAIRYSITEVAELADAPPMPAPSNEDVDRGGEGTESARVGVPHVGSTPTLGTNIDDVELARMADEGGPDGEG